MANIYDCYGTIDVGAKKIKLLLSLIQLQPGDFYDFRYHLVEGNGNKCLVVAFKRNLDNGDPLDEIDPNPAFVEVHLLYDNPDNGLAISTYPITGNTISFSPGDKVKLLLYHDIEFVDVTFLNKTLYCLSKNDYDIANDIWCCIKPCPDTNEIPSNTIDDKRKPEKAKESIMVAYS